MKIYIRSSMLSTYQDCPRRAAAKHWKKYLSGLGYEIKQLPITIGGAVGDGVHAAAKYMMEGKISGRVEKISDIIEVGMIKLSNKTAEEVRFDSVTGSINEAQKQCSSLINIFIDQAAPNLNPLALEVFRKATVMEGVEFGGSCDIETVGGSIHDEKYGSKYRPAQAQLGGYSILKKSETGESAKVISQLHIPRVKLGAETGLKVTTYDVSICERMAYAMIMHIVRDMKNFIKSQNPWCFPANPLSMLCSEKYCPAWKTPWCYVMR